MCWVSRPPGRPHAPPQVRLGSPFSSWETETTRNVTDTGAGDSLPFHFAFRSQIPTLTGKAGRQLVSRFPTFSSLCTGREEKLQTGKAQAAGARGAGSFSLEARGVFCGLGLLVLISSWQTIFYSSSCVFCKKKKSFSEEKMNTKNWKHTGRKLLFLAIWLFILILIPNSMEDNLAYWICLIILHQKLWLLNFILVWANGFDIVFVCPLFLK